MKLLVVAKFLLLAIAVVAGAVVGLSEIPWPDEYWEVRQGWVTAARITLVLVTALEAIRTAAAVSLRHHREKRAGLVEGVLYYTLVRLDEATADALRWHDIGIHVWELPRVPRWPRQLKKVARVRIENDGRGGTNIRWTRGTGAIGICWETGEGRVFNASALMAVSRDEWESRTDEERMGLDWRQAQMTKNYGGIVVMPMRSKKGRFRGCVSVDGPEGSFQTLRNKKVLEVVQNCASTCASTLYP
ncbi:MULTISPECIES: hypothetical protein [unclassified Egicoccus]|uniref:hypothetical protein n=1 Tax=unclassified Egicoccus TaxID=2635606 RepID=UPI00359D9329